MVQLRENAPNQAPFRFFSLNKQHANQQNRHPPAHPWIEGDILTQRILTYMLRNRMI
jgi:hypothetical protein